jgi:hypothetical protein
MTHVRPVTPTVAFIDQYCAQYRALFHNVRHFDQFTALHLGLLAETRRKSLPRLGQTVHVDPRRCATSWPMPLGRWRRWVRRRFILCVDETGDRKNGHTTDYAASQYIGNLHTLANDVVSVNAYSVLGTTTFPLLSRVFKPQTRLKAGDVYQTKPQLAIEIIEELLALGLRFSVVVADSLYGESGPFIAVLYQVRGARCHCRLRGLKATAHPCGHRGQQPTRMPYYTAWVSTTWWPCAPITASGYGPGSGSARRAGVPSTASSPTAAPTSGSSARRSSAVARHGAGKSSRKLAAVRV